MGAADFTNLWPGSDPKAAFAAATENARHEHGSGGYSGTLAEKGSFVIIQRNPVSEVEAYALASKLIEDMDERIDDKWGPAGAIPVITGTRMVLVEIGSGVTTTWRGDEAIAAATEALKATKGLRRGEKVISAELSCYTNVSYGSIGSRGPNRFTNGQARVTIQKPDAPTTRTVEVSITHDGKVDYSTAAEWGPKAAAKVKLGQYEKITGMQAKEATPTHKVVVESNSKAKAVTRYVLLGGLGTHFGTWEQGFATQAEARAKAVEISPSRFAPETIEVVGIIRREGNLPLVTVTRKTTKTAATVTVTILKAPPVPAGTTPDAWLFFGQASS